jgi:hypothetical protein
MTRTRLVRFGQAAIVAASVVAFAATSLSAGASAQLTKPQYIAKGDSICAGAIVQLRSLGYLRGGRASVAKVGSKWLVIDRRTLAALRRLAPPAADKATVTKLLKLADTAINTGVVNAIAAAKRSDAAYVTAARQATAMINKAHAGARAYGFSACSRW